MRVATRALTKKHEEMIRTTPASQTLYPWLGRPSVGNPAGFMVAFIGARLGFDIFAKDQSGRWASSRYRFGGRRVLEDPKRACRPSNVHSNGGAISLNAIPPPCQRNNHRSSAERWGQGQPKSVEEIFYAESDLALRATERIKTIQRAGGREQSAEAKPYRRSNTQPSPSPSTRIVCTFSAT